jgi:hypothetical protein
MIRVLLSICLISVVLFSAYARGNKKAEKDSFALVKFEKALATIETKDFVIIVYSYETAGGILETNSDAANFLSYEKDYVYLQGQIVAGNAHTNKLEVSGYNQTTDKKGNVRISMQVRGFFITAKIDISLTKKGVDYADVIITPTKGDMTRFSGYVVPGSQSKYFKRTGEI